MRAIRDANEAGVLPFVVGTQIRETISELVHKAACAAEDSGECKNEEQAEIFMLEFAEERLCIGPINRIGGGGARQETPKRTC